MKKKYFSILLIIILAPACRQVHNTVYLHNIYEKSEFTQPKNNNTEYKIQPYDILHITLNTFNTEIANLFNAKSSIKYNTSNNQSGTQANSNFYFNGYTVSPTGYITIPIIGNMFVKGKTVKEIHSELQLKITETIEDGIIDVKLVSFKITLLGEIAQQGILNILQERITIFETIAMAGGLTDYANRKKILIVRQTEEGTITIPIDLTDKKLLESEYYFLKPNDMLIIRPINAKLVRLSYSDFSMILSAITTTVTTIVLITNLNKPNATN